MNPNPNTSGLLPGRQKLFDEKQARELLELRQWSGPCTVARFQELAIENGLLTKACSLPTMHKLLSGRMYPDLIDPTTGKVFDYEALPHAAPGYQGKDEFDVEAPVDQEMKILERKAKREKMSLAKRRFAEVIMEDVKKYVRTHQAIEFTSQMQDRDRLIRKLLEEGVDLRKELARFKWIVAQRFDAGCRFNDDDAKAALQQS